MVQHIRKLHMLLSFLTPVFVLMLIYKIYSVSMIFVPEQFDMDESCPSVLERMMIGKWHTRNLTAREEQEISAFLMNGLFFVDPRRGFQKPDLTCGNDSYYSWMSSDPNAKWFRVLCDPNSATPCCYNNRCESRTVQECRCSNCYDLRSRIHAEYSLWLPDDHRCRVKNYTSQSACDLLNGSTLHFYGDSLVRQLFLALVIILKGDYKTGGLRPYAPQMIKNKCHGMYVFPTKNCRSYLDYKPFVCGGNVTVEFHHSANSKEIPAMIKAAMPLRHKKKTIILFGCGIWAHFEILDTVNYALSLLEMLFPFGENKSLWPKVVWSGFHHLGIWRQPLVSTVDNHHVDLFNRLLHKIVAPYKVPMFDTTNITKGVRSVDGTHFGPGINFLKAQIYLNYIAELQHKGMWH